MKTATIYNILLVITTTVLALGAEAAEITVLQQDKSFVKDGEQIEVLTVKAGDTINFQNDDPFFHNVFCLSDLETFDLGSYPKGESKPVKFDKPGVVEVECAIHPQMYMEVTVE